MLKSPPHTARIRLLLEIFPGAKFVHIHRNPYPVFQSSRRTFQLMFQWQGLQRPTAEGLDDWILGQYREMYEAFFEEKQRIPEGHFHEMSFEDLEKHSVEEVRRLYAALHLPDFGEVEPEIAEYVQSRASYRKNVFAELSPEFRDRISREWKVSFAEWGYSLAQDA